jgi:dTMP kinase
MRRFVVIEGIDGCGKSTQIRLLTDYLNTIKIKYKYMHFPRTGYPIFGEMIARFLRGEFGNVNNVNPYLVALLYANDRNAAKRTIETWLSRNYLVIIDRYVYSNIAFQCAKMKSLIEKEKLKKWIIDLEYGYNRIPRPSISIFLHAPFQFVTNKLGCTRQGHDRKYLDGKEDIHETDIELQRKVQSEYLRLTRKTRDFFAIDCGSKDGNMLPAEAVSNKIINGLVRRHLIKK